jgi:hypothetical protein
VTGIIIEILIYTTLLYFFVTKAPVFKKLAVAFAMVASFTPAHALFQYGVQPTLIGTDISAGTFIGLDINTNFCLYSGVYFVPGTSNLKEVMAVVLTAKATNRLVRVDFTRDAVTGRCTGYGIYLQ